MSRLRFRQSRTCDLTLKVSLPMPLWWRLGGGTRSALLSETKLANLENSDVKTTFVEQTVPSRVMERERKHYYGL